MSTFVIVHGAWGGGWEWSPVARLLREHDHEVFTPTLTGMGERAHVGLHEEVSLATHVDDVVAVMEFENLLDVVLVGASYGGVPVTGAADRAADRIKLVVYVDALVPLGGQSALDLLPEAFGATVRSGIAEHGRRWRVPMPPELLATLLPAASLPDDVRARYLAQRPRSTSGNLHGTGTPHWRRRRIFRERSSVARPPTSPMNSGEIR